MCRNTIPDFIGPYILKHDKIWSFEVKFYFEVKGSELW